MSIVYFMLFSIPTIGGVSGALRVYSPMPPEQGTFSWSIFGGYAFENFKYLDLSYDSLNPIDDKRHFLISSLSFAYSPFDYWELGIKGLFEGRQLERGDPVGTTRDDDGYVAYRGIDFFTKLGYPFFRDTVNKVDFSGGIIIGYHLPNLGIEKKDPKFVRYGFPAYIPFSGQFWSYLSLGLKLQILQFIGNVGFWQSGLPEKEEEVFPVYWVEYDEQGIPDSFLLYQTKESMDDLTRIPYGFNVTLSAGPYVDFIVDLHGLYFTEMRKSVLSITPGIRFKTPGGVVFDFAVDASLLKIEDENFKRLLALDKNLYTYYPDWRFIFVISNVLNVLPKKELPPPPPPPEPEVAKIIGKVYDNSTGEPLIAQVKITYPDTVLISPISTDENGFYTLELKPGTYSIRVEKEGYWWKEKRVILKKGAEVVIDFALKKKTLVFVSGKVLDNITEKPIGAKITIPETKFKGTVSDPETGLYKLKLPPGSYILRVEAEGYLPEEIPIILEEGVPVVKNIKLKKKAKKGVRITLQNIYFDTGKATIKPESYPVLDRVAEFLKANPDAIVEIQGHTDSVGSSSYNMSLSQARANSVKDYLVRYHGIDPRRLIAVGYGETKPIGDNTTREGRAMNRRVEFVIISTGEK